MDKDNARNPLLRLVDEVLLSWRGESVDRNLSAIFDHTRGLRNQTGHPTGEQVSAGDAEAGLLLFPGFCEMVDKIIIEISTTGTSSKGDASV